eukprot:1156161-Prymnesium_polylepis.2
MVALAQVEAERPPPSPCRLLHVEWCEMLKVSQHLPLTHRKLVTPFPDRIHIRGIFDCSPIEVQNNQAAQIGRGLHFLLNLGIDPGGVQWRPILAEAHSTGVWHGHPVTVARINVCLVQEDALQRLHPCHVDLQVQLLLPHGRRNPLLVPLRPDAFRPQLERLVSSTFDEPSCFE